MKRRGFVKKYGSAAVEDSTFLTFFEESDWHGFMNVSFANSFSVPSLYLSGVAVPSNDST